MLKILSKFIDSNDRAISNLQPLVDEINSQEPGLKKLTPAQVKKRTSQLKEEVQQGKVDLNSILPEAFALTRIAAQKSLKISHFDVQLMGGIALHQGRIAEMRTGEGKTLVATLPSYLNALAGKGVHVVTVNDYLARRDAEWMGQIYNFLGLNVGVINHDKSYLFDPQGGNETILEEDIEHPEEFGTGKFLREVNRKEAYNADVTYGTNNEFGFDYLRDNSVLDIHQKVQRGHYYAIVDEVDSILIDEARTPLIISAPKEEPTDKYYQFAKIVDSLNQEDFTLDEKHKAASLTDVGIAHIEKMLGVENLYEQDFKTLHHVEEALKAKTLFHRDQDYIVRDNEVIIVDEFTGRLMPGRRYSEGLHQAIEAKEGAAIQQESRTMATISFQNLFRMYEKLAGMTGTAVTEAEEFHKIYNLEVLVIPTNRPTRRQDHSDLVYKSLTGKFNAIASDIDVAHKSGQPVLVGTTSIEKNEYLSGLLKQRGVPHEMLNAKNHEREAHIIAKAGEVGSVTVATNMAGRGVDIKLGKGAADLGGLFVIGSERHEARRIDNQLRGRSGRQGDPGITRFYLSLEDDVMRLFGGDTVTRMMNTLNIPEDVPIESGLVSRAIESAQTRVEGHNFDIRKQLVDYDDVMNRQRQIIYQKRDNILKLSAENPAGLKAEITNIVQSEVTRLVDLKTSDHGEVDYGVLITDINQIAPFDDASRQTIDKQLRDLGDAEKIKESLHGLINKIYDAREQAVSPDVMRQIEKFVILNVIDVLWTEHLDTMDDLRSGVGLRGYGQRDPLVEYKGEAFSFFERLVSGIDYEVARRIFHVNIQIHNTQPPFIPDTKAQEPIDPSSKKLSPTPSDLSQSDQQKLSQLQTYIKKHGRKKLNSRMKKLAHELESKGVKI
jgi:preprotein translocase subunit SecA